MRRRDEVWGDEPREIDASATVEEFGSNTEVLRDWDTGTGWAPLEVVWGFIKRNGKRVAVTIAGFAVLLAGVAMLVLPGPGVVVILAGLAILSTEYVWAQRLLNKAKAKFDQAKDAVLGKKDEAASPEE